jgi:hypothetical protein
MSDFRALGRAVEWAVGEAGTGTQQICLVCEITEGPHKGSQYTWYGFLNTDDNIERTLKSLQYLGWDGKNFAKLDGLGTEDAMLVVKDEMWEGKRQTRIAFVNSKDSDGIIMSKRYDENELTSFAEQMNRRMADLRARKGGGGNVGNSGGSKGQARPAQQQQRNFGGGSGNRPPPTNPAGPGVGDDDIPF